MVMARNQVTYTSILYKCYVFKHLLMQYMVRLTSQKQRGGKSWLILSINNKVQTMFLLWHGLGQESRQSDL